VSPCVDVCGEVWQRVCVCVSTKGWSAFLCACVLVLLVVVLLVVVVLVVGVVCVCVCVCVYVRVRVRVEWTLTLQSLPQPLKWFAFTAAPASVRADRAPSWRCALR
jgi:hypothetical protein